MDIKPIERPKRTYICTLCGSSFKWSKKAYWYGSKKDVDELHPSHLQTFCGCVDFKEAKEKQLQYKKQVRKK